MEVWQAIILGIVQGATEFIPVSSSGHLELARQIMGFQGENFHLFMEFINLGTLLALLIYFRHRILRILRNVFQEKNYKLAINIVITCIPAGLAGVLLSDVIENNGFFSSLYTIAGAMALVGLVMIFIDKIPHMRAVKNEDHLDPKKALFIGLIQMLALIPGTSRSGTTIVAGRIAGMDSESSAEYSFLVSIPIMCGVCLKMFLSESSRAYFGANFGILMLGNVVAFLVGLFALKFVLDYLKKPHTLQSFGRYRVILSSVVIGVLLIMA